MRKIIISLLLFPGFLALGAIADELKLAPDAPDRYVVQKGDTLWDISGRYLRDPWRWPQLWGMNKDQVKNPHLIYPGDVLVLDRSGGTPRLARGMETVKLSPRVRETSTGRNAIPTIAAADLRAFLARPLIIDANGLDGSPRIAATQEGRVIASAGDLVGVTGLPRDQGLVWDIYEPGKALKDPETEEILGYEAVHLGAGRVYRFEDPISIIEITAAKEEILTGSRLVKASDPGVINFVPRAPEKDISGRIISNYRAGTEVGPNAIVVLNRGRRDGVAPGHVFQVMPNEGRANFERGAKNIEVPPIRIGLVMAFRVFDRVTYALVMDAKRPIGLGDVVRNP
ncbi:MAG: LysM peptidoglycan-binding domain-containing protein [Pseudomonadota bacterium]